MILQNLHAHSTYDDGKDTPRAMIDGALAAGLSALGISLHSPLPFRNSWTARIERMPAFFEEMRALREAFAGRLDVYAGMEWDVLSPKNFGGAAYVIGSAHYLTLNGEHFAVDKSAETTRTWLEGAFDGDADEAARLYFAQVGALAEMPEIDIVGHFDLLTKYDEQERFFCPYSDAYRKAALDALERVVAAGKIVEINTGAISRGYRTTPYPARIWLEEIARRGGRVTVSSDAHQVGHVAFGLEDAVKLAWDCGFREIWEMQGDAFAPRRIDE